MCEEQHKRKTTYPSQRIKVRFSLGNKSSRTFWSSPCRTCSKIN